MLQNHLTSLNAQENSTKSSLKVRFNQYNKLKKQGYIKQPFKGSASAVFKFLVESSNLHGYCYHGVKSIADSLDISEATVKRATDTLIKCKFIIKDKLYLNDGVRNCYIPTNRMDELITIGENLKRNAYFDKQLKQCGTVIEGIYSTEEYYIEDVSPDLNESPEPIAQLSIIDRVNIKCSNFDRVSSKRAPNINNNILNKNNLIICDFEKEKSTPNEQTKNDQTEKLALVQKLIDNADMELLKRTVNLLMTGNTIDQSKIPQVKQTHSDRHLPHATQGVVFKEEKKFFVEKSSSDNGSYLYDSTNNFHKKANREVQITDDFCLESERFNHIKAQTNLTDEQINNGVNIFHQYAKRIKATSSNWQKACSTWIVKTFNPHHVSHRTVTQSRSIASRTLLTKTDEIKKYEPAKSQDDYDTWAKKMRSMFGDSFKG